MELRLKTIFALIDNLIPMILFRSDLKNILQNSIVAKIAKSSDTDHIRGRVAGVRHPTAEEWHGNRLAGVRHPTAEEWHGNRPAGVRHPTAEEWHGNRLAKFRQPTWGGEKNYLREASSSSMVPIW